MRIASNGNFSRLYPLLRDGILDLLNSKLRWSNEPIEIIPKSVHGSLEFSGLQAVIRIRDALHARVRGEYNRIVYPYFSEEPKLPEEGGRLGLWAMQKALTPHAPEDMRIIDILRKAFFSPQVSPLKGDEDAVFSNHYEQLLVEWERLKKE